MFCIGIEKLKIFQYIKGVSVIRFDFKQYERNNKNSIVLMNKYLILLHVS